ncbi:hypothetical protein Y032_0002g542 [Ancylostoma ceylanicum]|nr:hypothetical protein Y032_0002g542 [Ancylostoma ceylanicum]
MNGLSYYNLGVMLPQKKKKKGKRGGAVLDPTNPQTATSIGQSKSAGCLHVSHYSLLQNDPCSSGKW